MVLDAAGNSYVVGGFSGSNSTFGTIVLPNSGSSGTYELCVAKLSAQGTWLWARSGGGTNQDGGTALAVDASGSVYLAGFSQAGPATFGPFALPNTTSGNDDILVAKLDAFVLQPTNPPLHWHCLVYQSHVPKYQMPHS